MAIVGSLDRFEGLCKKMQALQCVWDYMKSAMQEGNEVRERITKLPLKSPQKLDLGNGIFVIEQAYMTKPYEEAFFESHQKYIDFQLVLAGKEIFATGEKGDFALVEPYNEAKDLIVYSPLEKECSSLVLHQGFLAILFPYDVHAGSLKVGKESERVSKSVIKVPVELVKHSL